MYCDRKSDPGDAREYDYEFEKKQWLGLNEIEKLFHAVPGTYTPRFRMFSISIASNR